MKIIATIIIVLATLLVCISLAISSGVDLKKLTASGDLPSLDSITHKIKLEPVLMIIVGTGFIAIAGIGRKRLLKKDPGDQNKKKLGSATIPYPDPVPWKAEN